MENEKTKIDLLNEYIDKYYSYIQGDKEMTKQVSESLGFNSYIMKYHVDRLGEKIKNDLASAAKKANTSFKKFTKSIKK